MAVMPIARDWFGDHRLILYLLVTLVAVGFYVSLVNQHRFSRLNAIKQKYGFTNDPKSYKDMTPDQAHEVGCNLAEFEMPWLYEFAWLFDFLRVSTLYSSIIIAMSVYRHLGLRVQT